MPETIVFFIKVLTLKQASKQASELKKKYIGRSNKILGWEGVGKHQLFCFFKA
jgi:hypothetical protein